MKVKIGRKAVVTLAKMASDIMERRNANPSFLNLVLSADDVQPCLVLHCARLGVALSASFDAEVVEPGDVVVSGAVFAQIVKALPNGDDVTIETMPGPMRDLVIDDEKLQISCGRSKTAIKAHDGAEGPGVYVFDMMSSFSGDAKIGGGWYRAGVISAVGKYVGCAAARDAEDEATKRLENICMEIDAEGKAAFASTDGRRLAHAVVEPTNPPENGAERTCRVVIPCAALDAIIDMCDKSQEDNALHFKTDGGRLIVAHKDWNLAVSLSDAVMPDYRKALVFAEGIRETVLPKNDFITALRRVLVIDPEKNVSLAMQDGKATMEVEEGTNLAHDEFDIPDEIPPFKTCLRGRFLSDAVLSLPGDTFTLHYTDEIGPVHVTAGCYHYVIMPIRKNPAADGAQEGNPQQPRQE